MILIPYEKFVNAFAVKRLADSIDKRIFNYLKHNISEDNRIYSLHQTAKNLPQYKRAKLQVILNQNSKQLRNVLIKDQDKFHLMFDFYPYNIHVCSLSYRMLSENLFGHLLSGIREMYSVDKITSGERDVYTSAIRYVNSMSFGPETARNFTIRKDGTMTCQPKNTSTTLTNEDTWCRDTRQEIKIGRALRHIFQPSGLQYMDNIIEYLTHYLKAQYQFNGNIKIHDGSEIKKYYYEGCYLRNQGSLNSSCMKYDSTQEYLDILKDHAEIVVAHSITNPDKILGRALLWTTTNGTKVMDRIYGNETTRQAFIDFAKENNFVYKTYQNYSSPQDFMVDGESQRMKFTIDANPFNYEYLPYMDTFKYYSDSSNQLNNRDGTYELTMTDGNPPHQDDENYVTLYDGERIHCDDAIWVESECEYYRENEVTYS